MAAPDHATGGSALLFATIATAFNPLLAEWSLILIGGFIGAFLAATGAETPTLRAALLIFARGFAMAMLFTGVGAWIVATQFNLNADWLLLPVAGAIAWQQDRLAGAARAFIANRRGTS